jgi:hypothetical protein
MSEIRFPAQSPAAYLAWASWWHRLDRHLEAVSNLEGADAEVSVVDRSEVWDGLLEIVSRQASRAMLSHDRTMEPMLRAPKQDFAEAARVLRSRLAWLGHAVGEDLPRPDGRVSRLTGVLLGSVEEAAAGATPRPSVA